MNVMQEWYQVLLTDSNIRGCIVTELADDWAAICMSGRLRFLIECHASCTVGLFAVVTYMPRMFWWCI